MKRDPFEMEMPPDPDVPVESASEAGSSANNTPTLPAEVEKKEGSTS